MRISSQLLTNELVLRFLSEPPQFCPNPRTVALLPCCEWWPICKCVMGGGQCRDTLMHWQSLRERPGLCSQRQVFHCGTVTVTGNYLYFKAKDLLTFIVVEDRKVGALIRSLGFHKNGHNIYRWHYDTCYCPVSRPAAHCTLWHWIFWNFAKATRQAPARSLPSTWACEGTREWHL